MCQAEVLKFMNDMRQRSDEWLTSRQVKDGLIKQGCEDGEIKGVGSDLLRLAQFGFISVRGIGWWEHHKEYRGRLDG